MDVITKFLNYLEFEKRVSPHTITSYGNDLKQFFTYYIFVLFPKIAENNDPEIIGEKLKNIDISSIEAPLIRSWIVELLENKIEARSVNRKISSLKSFYNYHLKIGTATKNPMIHIRGPKTSKRLPVYVEEEEISFLFSQDFFPDSFEGIRDRTILELFYATGMRLSELINLKHSDIDMYECTVKVLGKRNKERIIPFGKTMKELLIIYITKKELFFGGLNQQDYLFITNISNKMYPKAVYRIVNKYLDMVTNLSKKSPHIIRHTFATHMLNRGADINAIKEILGHSSLAATQVYTHNSIEKLKSIYKQAHPRA